MRTSEDYSEPTLDEETPLADTFEIQYEARENFAEVYDELNR